MSIADIIPASATMPVRIPYHLVETEVRPEPYSRMPWDQTMRDLGSEDFKEEEVMRILFAAVCLMSKGQSLEAALGIAIIWERG